MVDKFWDVRTFHRGQHLYIWGNWFAEGCYFWAINYSRWRWNCDYHRIAFQLGRGEIVIDFGKVLPIEW